MPESTAANSQPASMAATVLAGVLALVVGSTGFGKHRGIPSCIKFFHLWVHRASAGESFSFY